MKSTTNRSYPAVVVLFWLACGILPAQTNYDEIIDHAKSLIAQGQLGEAATESLRAIQIDRRRWDAWALAGISYGKQSNPEDCRHEIPFLQSALERAPAANKAPIQTALRSCRAPDDVTPLKRPSGDLGIVGGLLATDAIELEYLKALGERNYIAFRVAIQPEMKKVGDIALRLGATDPQRNRFSLTVQADNKTTEKADRDTNSPLQFYVSGVLYEIVVNNLARDFIDGYLSTPKYQPAPMEAVSRPNPPSVPPANATPPAPVFDVNATYARAAQLYNAKDYSGALPLMHQSADAGNKEAMHQMGWSYQNGLGVAVDYHAAMDWYRKAAEAGNANSMINLGSLYQNGLGVAVDYGTAMQWYRRAADGSSGAVMGAAINDIGYLYENGLGVTRDRDQALASYQKGANLGVDEARKNLQRLSALPPVAPVQPTLVPTTAPAMKEARVTPPATPAAAAAVPGPRMLMPAKGDVLPGTRWTFDRFDLSEGGAGQSWSVLPDALGFGSNSRFIQWALIFNVPKNTQGTLQVSCRYFDAAGTLRGKQMDSSIQISAKDKGLRSFTGSQGSANSGEFWQPGNYQVVCATGGSTIVQASFRVVDSLMYFLTDIKGVYNPVLLIGTMGYAGLANRFYPGELLISSNGVEWKDSGTYGRGTKGKSDFSASCSGISVSTEKDKVKLEHGGQTATLVARSPQYAQTVSNAVQSACRK